LQFYAGTKGPSKVKEGQVVKVKLTIFTITGRGRGPNPAIRGERGGRRGIRTFRQQDELARSL